MHCCKLRLFEVTLNTHLSRIIVKSYSAQVEKHRRMTGLVNAIILSVSVLIISVREQEQDRSELVFVVKVSGPLHSSPVVPLTPWPLSFHPACSCVSPSSLCVEESCSAEDLVTPPMTAAVSLSYQLHWLTDTLANPDPSFYSPSGNVYHFRHYPPPSGPMQTPIPLQDLHKPLSALTNTPYNTLSVSLDMLHAAVLNGEYVLSPRSPLWWKTPLIPALPDLV